MIMARRLIVTEAQMERIVERLVLSEGGGDPNRIVLLFKKGLVSAALAISLITAIDTLSEPEKSAYREMIEKEMKTSEKPQWRLAADDVTVTVYNACAGQCNDDFRHTASMFRLNLNDVASHRIVAMERTFMKELGLSYGDVIKLEGTYKGRQDGIYQVQDTMNKRFAGQHKVDVLVPGDIRTGGTLPGKKAKIYVLNDKEDTADFLANMAPSHHK